MQLPSSALLICCAYLLPQRCGGFGAAPLFPVALDCVLLLLVLTSFWSRHFKLIIRQ
jgi:hypothetical protein